MEFASSYLPTRDMNLSLLNSITGVPSTAFLFKSSFAALPHGTSFLYNIY